MQQLHDIRQAYVQTLADHGTALPNIPQIEGLEAGYQLPPSESVTPQHVAP
jgi:hypothetical protein